MEPIPDRASKWIVSCDTGASSKTIWSVMMGVERSDRSYPHDPGDFGRCYRLLTLIPEWRARLAEMATVSNYWSALVENWEKIERQYLDELAGNSAPKTYKLMQSILRPIEDADRNVIRMGDGATLCFGLD